MPRRVGQEWIGDRAQAWRAQSVVLESSWTRTRPVRGTCQQFFCFVRSLSSRHGVTTVSTEVSRPARRLDPGRRAPGQCHAAPDLSGLDLADLHGLEIVEILIDEHGDVKEACLVRGVREDARWVSAWRRAGAAVAGDRARGAHVEAGRRRAWRRRRIRCRAADRPSLVRHSDDRSRRIHHRPVRAPRRRRRCELSAGPGAPPASIL
jgi:hypothetical protein